MEAGKEYVYFELVDRYIDVTSISVHVSETDDIHIT